MKNWRTTAAGIVGALALGAVEIMKTGDYHNPDLWIRMASVAVLGLLAKDAGVTGTAR